MKTLLIWVITSALITHGAADSQPVADGVNQFGLDLYRRLAKDGGNLVTSPWSIETALAMTYAGAAGRTKDEMRSVLHFPKDDAGVHNGVKAITADLTRLMKVSQERVSRSATAGGPATPVEIHAANRLFGQQDFAFAQPFPELTTSAYGAPLERMDFKSDGPGCTKAINRWVASQSKDRIRDLIAPDVLSAETRLVLTNAVYFKASWMRAFDEMGIFNTSSSGARCPLPPGPLQRHQVVAVKFGRHSGTASYFR